MALCEGSPLKRARKGLASPSATAVPKPSPIPRVPREMSHQRDSASDFEPLRFLGKGAFGAVVLVQRKNWPDRRYAMKVLLKRKLGGRAAREMALVEREILRTVRHSYLVPLCCSFQSRTRLYLVTPSRRRAGVVGPFRAGAAEGVCRRRGAVAVTPRGGRADAAGAVASAPRGTVASMPRSGRVDAAGRSP